jgi:spore maturation protein B
MSSYIIPSLIIALVIYSIVKKENAYNHFVFGAKTSFDLILISFPYLVAIFIIIELFEVSGLSNYMATILRPFLNVLGIPTELIPIILIKPFSGCGSLAVLENIFTTYGVDSYLARAGSAIAGSSEAIFFVSAVYFSKTKVSKFGFAIPIALIANLIGAIVACWVCRVI